MERTPPHLIEEAKAKALNAGRIFAVVEMDSEDDRKFYIVNSDYVDSYEFEVFCGEVYGFAFADGTYSEDI